VLIASQTRVFAQDPSARSRLNTIFIGSMFTGGAMGSALAMSVYRQGGWGWLAMFASGLALTAAALQIVHHQRRSAATG
jgi:predicted MFS family arabinose efflux permease